ncbi:hypothetical protein [Nocardioides zeicaulis]|uniref:MFS transporter n=1 Tax=Nocardioides zeicaulis TaxID=1776857 RepID=A0ABV6DY33_9ACTN
MDHRADPFARCARAVVLAGVVLLAGSLAHVSADGLLPGLGSMTTLFVVLVAACAALLGRAASAGRLVALTVGGQLAVHTALSVLAGHRGEHHAGGGAALMPHVHEAAPDGPWTWATHALQDVLERPAMALAHVAASVLIGLWLAVGERALWALVTLARCRAGSSLREALRVLGATALLPHDVRRAVVVRPARDEPRPQLPLWSRGPARRGPPAVQPTR